MMLSRQPNYQGPEILHATAGHAGAFAAGRTVGLNHRSGYRSLLRSPAKVVALVHDPSENVRAYASLTIEVFGPNDGGGLRMGTSSFDVRGLDGAPVSGATVRRLKLRDLEVVTIMLRARGAERAHPSGAPCIEGTSPCHCLTESEARDYLDPRRNLEPVGVQSERDRIADAWWEAKIAGRPIGTSVAIARGEDAPGSKAAWNRANVYVAELRRRGVLAEVGRRRGLDLDAYGVT